MLTLVYRCLHYFDAIFLFGYNINSSLISYLEKYGFSIYPPKVCDWISTMASTRNQLQSWIAIWAEFLWKSTNNKVYSPSQKLKKHLIVYMVTFKSLE